MNKNEFEQFVLENGNDILRFCRMTTGNEESGNDLYQDTMLKLLEKQNKLNLDQNVKSYALSISILLLKNKKKKYAVRNNIVKFTSLDEIEEEEGNVIGDFHVTSPVPLGSGTINSLFPANIRVNFSNICIMLKTKLPRHCNKDIIFL